MSSQAVLTRRVCVFKEPSSIPNPCSKSLHTHSSQSSSHFHTRNFSVLGDHGPSPSSTTPPPPLVSTSPRFERPRTRASAHSSDRLMNLNRGGFQSLDGAGGKPDAYSADSPPVGPPAVYQLGLTRPWNTGCVCVPVVYFSINEHKLPLLLAKI